MIVLASLTDTAQGIVETFGIDWPMLIAQAINFLIVAFVIWKFAFKNILSTIKEREKQIADSLSNADKIKLELEETEKQQQETLQEASLEAKKTISIAQEQAKRSLKNRRKMLASRRKKSSLRRSLLWNRKGNAFFARLVKKLLP